MNKGKLPVDCGSGLWVNGLYVFGITNNFKSFNRITSKDYINIVGEMA